MPSLIVVLDHVFVPLTIIIAITSVIGVLGNGMAFYIFKFRFPASGFNILMAALAVYDILACAIHMPLDIATFFDIGHLRSYLCKITCFQLAFTATGAALILMAIAFVRFMGICKPIAASFSTRSAYYVITISVLISSGIALPITILFGDGELETDANVTARICAVESKYMSTSGPISYYLILASLYIITFICHTCLYIKAVLIIWKQRRTFVTMKGNKNVIMMSPAPQRDLNRFQRFPTTTSNDSPNLPRSANADQVRHSSDTLPTRLARPTVANHSTTTQTENESVSEINSNQPGILNSTRIQNSTSSPRPLPRTNLNLHSSNNIPPPIPLPRSLPPSTTNMTDTATSETLNGNSTDNKNNNSPNNTNYQNSYHILAVVIAISVTYFLSYAPHFGVMFYLFTHDKAVFTASAQSLVFELLMRSFFLNNILDPVIYGLLSTDFRNQVKRILCGFSGNKS